MKRRKSGKLSFPKHMDLPCDELGPEDGVDPRILFRRESREKRGYKDHQLCKQVFRTINYWLSEHPSQGWAAEMYVSAVTPGPDAGRLQVAVAFGRSLTLDEAEAAVAQLRKHGATLRWEVAQAIVRKRVPELAFVLSSSPDNGEEDE